MTGAIVIGGGLAGLAAATALAQAGHQVQLFEAKPFPGGRATSYRFPCGDGEQIEIDNCQHILLKCCVNLLDFYRRLGVSHHIEFHREFYFLEPGGRMSTLRRGALPAPFHFAESFLRAAYLSFTDKLALSRALAALWWERTRRPGLDNLSMADWLREKRQPPRLVERFWRQVLVSAINVELPEMAASHGFQVLWLGFLAAADSYEMGISQVPLAHLYQAALPHFQPHFRQPVLELDPLRGIRTASGWHAARVYISSLPARALSAIAPQLDIPASQFAGSPIIGIHLWFDRPVTALPHGALLDRTLQWFYAKDGGRYLSVVVSAADPLVKMPQEDIVALALRELPEFLPALPAATLLRSRVVKEVHATFRARPGLASLRPDPPTRYPNLFLAGDWTNSGWPSTMEGAVRSGYRAAEAAAQALGRPQSFLLPDIA
jgi:zeta-carotene desaturase